MVVQLTGRACRETQNEKTQPEHCQSPIAGRVAEIFHKVYVIVLWTHDAQNDELSYALGKEARISQDMFGSLKFHFVWNSIGIRLTS